MPRRLRHQDIKAGLRKRFGSVAEFERARSFGPGSVSDQFRGRTSARVRKAIAEALGIKLSQVQAAERPGGRDASDISDADATSVASQAQAEGAR